MCLLSKNSHVILSALIFRRGDGGRFSMRSANNNSSLSRVANSSKALMDPSVLKPPFRTGGGNIAGFGRSSTHKVGRLKSFGVFGCQINHTFF
jgi:hypothetical protein